MYVSEVRANGRPLFAACLGMGVGTALSHYTMSLFGPPLLAEFGWSKADYALIGTLPIVTMIVAPLAGWFVDRYGVRIAAITGFAGLSLGYLAFTLMTGDLAMFFAIWALQHVFGGLTATIVFCRAVVERFDKARGLALSLVMTGAPLGGAIAAPLIGALIGSHGWRAGYVALAAISGIGGLLVVLLMGRTKIVEAVRSTAPNLTRGEMAALARSPVLLFLLAGMFLVNIPQLFASSQLKLIAMDSGVASEAATWLISLYAIGVVIGRFLTGLALDRLPAHLIALATLGLPAIGYLVFASEATSLAMLASAVMVIGLAQGAEGDLGSFLVARHFDLRNFSFLLSLLTVMLAAGGVCGSFVLSAMLRGSSGYAPFLVLSAVATLVGALLFAMAGRGRKPGELAGGGIADHPADLHVAVDRNAP